MYKEYIKYIHPTIDEIKLAASVLNQLNGAHLDDLIGEDWGDEFVDVIDKLSKINNNDAKESDND